MRFRVTSIAWEEESQLISAPIQLIEDWLNAALGDGDFGGSLRNLMLLIITHYPDDEPEPGKARKISRLSTYKNPFSGEIDTMLTLNIHLEAPPLLAAGSKNILGLLSQQIVEQLPAKPLRSPKGLDYPRLVLAIAKAIQVFLGYSAAPRSSARAA